MKAGNPNHKQEASKPTNQILNRKRKQAPTKQQTQANPL